MSDKLARTTDSHIAGTYGQPQRLTKALQEAADTMNLVSPATACGSLPDGCEVALSAILVDVENETYDVGAGKRGLAKTALDRIAAASGISWDAQQSGRLDDGSDPHYVAFKAVGRLRHFDGAEMQIVGTKEMDLREGSAQVEALWERYHAAKAAFDKGTSRAKWPPKEPTAQIREMRLHIMAHAESKARLRAIRSIGLRPSYTAEELRKPFMVAKIMFTGYSEDPELRRIFASKRADAMLGGMQSLYGSAPTPALVQPVAIQAARLAPPPPVGSVQDDDVEGEESAPPAPRPARTQTRTEDGGTAIYMPGKKDAPKILVTDAEDRSLTFWEDRISKALDAGESRYPDKERATLAAIRAEIARRDGSAATTGKEDDDIPY